jgi:CubicO group peptidase (beta-lactamase class C family)
VDALRQIDEWGAEHAAAAVVERGEVVAEHGDAAHVLRWASITKLVVAYALLIAVEEGAIDLDDPTEDEGVTVRHLAAHAGGYGFDKGSPQIAPPGTRRIYSNEGYERLARAMERATEISIIEYVQHAVAEPLGIRGGLRELAAGTAAGGFWGDLADLIALAREFLRPTLVAPETLSEATTVQFPGLGGVLPGFGRLEPNDWGIGFELRDAKSPHWTGTRNTPRTYGHFGGTGTFLWVDPERDLALGVLTDREYDDWVREAWPRLSDAVLTEAA